MLFPHIQSNEEQSPVTTHDSDVSKIIQTVLYTSPDTSKNDDNVFDDDLFLNDQDDTSICATIGESVILKDYHHSYRS